MDDSRGQNQTEMDFPVRGSFLWPANGHGSVAPRQLKEVADYPRPICDNHAERCHLKPRLRTRVPGSCQ